MEKKIRIYIDGKEIKYTGFMEDTVLGHHIGGVAGSDSDVPLEDEFISWTPNKLIWYLAVEYAKKGEKYWGLQGIFRYGMWGYDEDGNVTYSVWERLA